MCQVSVHNAHFATTYLLSLSEPSFHTPSHSAHEVPTMTSYSARTIFRYNQKHFPYTSVFAKPAFDLLTSAFGVTVLVGS